MSWNNINSRNLVKIAKDFGNKLGMEFGVWLPFLGSRTKGINAFQLSDGRVIKVRNAKIACTFSIITRHMEVYLENRIKEMVYSIKRREDHDYAYVIFREIRVYKEAGHERVTIILYTYYFKPTVMDWVYYRR